MSNLLFINKYRKNNKSFQLACERGHLDVVKYLLSLNIKIDPSADNNRAISNAISSGHLDVVKYLMSLPKEYGIDPHASDNYAIKIAIYNGNIKMANYLDSVCGSENVSKKYKKFRY